MGGIAPATLASLVMLAVIALAAGGVATIRRGDRTKGVLMIVCALVILGNLAIWLA
ncbi:hypothetical protein [Sphingomonas sp.]|uniref:hypothetical protein n=1 Tax=Sphingomonas sp. TaxID=28214 RepID=UPI001B1C90EB|nr:hypothetical protein [Sphingomonas sp.]MBO9713544.1 hypothetical protein [Sphingomonas sp.]